MKKYKIAIYAICKNESAFVQRWYDSVKEADVICVVDTGSTDNTFELLQELPKVITKQKIFDPWRFDDARNESLDLVPDDVDICLCIDLDETLDKGWYKAIEKAWQADTTIGKYLFNLSFDSNGNPTSSMQNTKLHLRHGYRWAYPVHEVLKAQGIKDKWQFIPNMVLNHHPDNNKSRDTYLPLLEQAVIELPTNPRQKFLLAREYVRYKKYDEAIKVGHEYMAFGTKALDKVEKNYCDRAIAKAYLGKEWYIEAEAWFMIAHQECPHLREPLAELGFMYFKQEEYAKSREYLLKAIKIKEKTPGTISSAEAWGSKIYDYLSCACFRVNKYKEAFKYCQQSLKIDKDNKNTLKNLRLIKEQLDKEKKD